MPDIVGEIKYFINLKSLWNEVHTFIVESSTSFYFKQDQ